MQVTYRNMKLAIVVNVIVLDRAQHSSRIALYIHGNRDPLEEDMLICVCASTYFTVECNQTQGFWVSTFHL